MAIRKATADDAETIARIQVASWQAAYRGLVPDEKLDAADPAELVGSWNEVLAISGLPVFIAVGDDDRTVGFCLISTSGDEDSGDDAAEIVALYIHPDAWRRGHGTALCERAIAEARDRGFAAVTLWVLKGNDRAEAFYEGLGFVFDDTRTAVWFDVEVTKSRFRLALA